MTPTSIAGLRRYAVSRSLFPPTTLQGAIDRLGFVQADPIRAPARAQDLTLRHRVLDYRSGDLEARYSELDVEEDIFINYGFVPRAVQELMHPRSIGWRPAGGRRVRAILDFVNARGSVHPREVDAEFSHGRVTNYWGGSSNATTHLMEHMHYYGFLRVVRREAGIRIYAVHRHGAGPSDAAGRRANIDRLVDVLVGKYAPLPALSLSNLLGRLRHAVPQWRKELTAALRRAKERLAHERVEGVEWYWPAGERIADAESPGTVRLLAPFDPVVWDRRRFEMLWNWPYRFEAYTPVRKRKLGYYALPLLWRDRVIGWSNVTVRGGDIAVDAGYAGASSRRDRAFSRELDAELDRLRMFLGVCPSQQRVKP